MRSASPSPTTTCLVACLCSLARFALIGVPVWVDEERDRERERGREREGGRERESERKRERER